MCAAIGRGLPAGGKETSTSFIDAAPDASLTVREKYLRTIEM
jgi:hypothetical protein